MFWPNFEFVKFNVGGAMPKPIEEDSLEAFVVDNTSLSVFFESIRLPPKLMGANLKPPTF